MRVHFVEGAEVRNVDLGDSGVVVERPDCRALPFLAVRGSTSCGFASLTEAVMWLGKP